MARSYVTSFALLLLLMRTSTGLPVRTPNAQTCAQCSALFQALLHNFAKLLKSDQLCFGIPSDGMMLRSQSDTVTTCTPTVVQNLSCMVQRNSSFNETECLGNIMKDLVFYESALQSYLTFPLRNPEDETALLRPALALMQGLKRCSLMPEEQSSENMAHVWGTSSFSNRQQMCKLVRGFHTRIITINRAVSYISSADHRR
ncbi:interleukin-12 subunit alpha [Thalassophryne amazonica]|uniref:interleukin-12 subunit alpha n=1 Tax=Thalassophryne amazonica TaxID=390379 RepID=UPI001471269F|nr:interleukin-12 subunit alpha [Thalassophryne amazonica]